MINYVHLILCSTTKVGFLFFIFFYFCQYLQIRISILSFGRDVLRGYPTQYIIFLHLMFNQNKCWSSNIYGHKKWNFDDFFNLKVTVAMETAAILEIWRNYDFSFFWLTKRAIFKIPNQCYYLYIILCSDRRKLLFKSHKVQFGRICDHKISIFGKKSVFGSKKYLFFSPNFLLSLHT